MRVNMCVPTNLICMMAINGSHFVVLESDIPGNAVKASVSFEIFGIFARRKPRANVGSFSPVCAL